MVVDDYARRGVAAFMQWHERRQGLKEKLATLLGARAEDFGLVPNTTTGVLHIAQCFPWKPGDRVVVFEGDFPANVTPWQQAAARYDLQVHALRMDRFFGPSGDGLGQLETLLRAGGVRLVAVSSVQFQTGLRMPVEQMGQLCHRFGAQLFVDGIQGLGVDPLAVSEHIDYLACGSHKWLMGLEGCGFLYVAPARVSQLRPVTAGWLSHEQAIDFLFEPDKLRHDRPIRKQADFVEGGAYAAVGYAALETALAGLLSLGVGVIQTHVQAYLDALEAGLVDLGLVSQRSRVSAQRSGILAMTTGEGLPSVAQLGDGLVAQGIAVTYPDGRLRFAPHWPNALEEVPRVVDAVRDVLQSRPRS